MSSIVIRERRARIGEIEKMKCRERNSNMTKVIKNMVKRAFVMCGVGILAFAVLVSGFSTANPAYADDHKTSYKYYENKTDELKKGHMDIFYPFMHNKKMIMGFEANSMLYKPENVTMRVGNSSYSTKPFDNYKNKLPFDASKGYWLLDESGNKSDTELFPGWDTSIARYAVDAENPDGATADIVVQKVIAPKGGKVLVWETDKNKQGEHIAKSFEYKDKDDVEGEEGSRFELPGVIHQPQVTHQHTNWVFTEPGTYTLEVYAVIKNRVTQKTVQTDTAKYTFEVDANSSHMVSSDSVVRERGKAEIPVLDANTKDEDPSDNPECQDGQLCILGVRKTGSHPHYHSYEEGGDVNLYTYMDGLKEKIASGEIGRPSYKWCITRADEQEGTEGTCFDGERLILPPEPAMNNMQVSVVVTASEGFFDFGTDRATAKIVVEDHGADGRPVVAISGKNKVKIGETVRLNAKLYSPRVPVVNGKAGDPEVQTTSIVKKYRWMIKKDGEKEFKNIPMAEGKTLDLVIDKSMQDAVIRASLVLDNGTLYRNAGYDDFCDWNVNIKRDRKDGDAGETGDSGAHKNRKQKRKQNRKHAKNRKKNKSHESATDENDENNNGDENGDETDAEDSQNEDSNSNSDLEKNRKKNKKKSDEKSDKKLDENDDNSGSQSQSENKIQSVTPLAAVSGKGGALVNVGKSGRLGGGFAGLGVSGKSKKSKAIKKSKPLKSSSKKAKNSHQDSNDSSDYNDSDLDDEQENSEENSHKTKWVAAAVGTASVSLCAITGAGAFLMKPRIKLL